MPVAQVVPTPQMASKRKSTAACNGSNGLSTTGSAPRVQRPMKAAKSPAVRPSGNETAATKPVPSSIPEDYPFEHKDNIACPFPKHNPDRYTHVRESCTIGWGFSDTGKLNEHIRRVHTRSFGCLRCGHRFTNISKPKLSEAKAAHKCSKETTAGKEFKPDPRFGPEWLDERQEAAYFDLNFARGNSSEAPQVVFERIFNALWPEVPQKDIPSHLHMPGFFQATHKVEQMRQEMNRQAKQLRQSGQEKDQQIEALKEQIRNMNAMAMQSTRQTGYTTRISSRACGRHRASAPIRVHWATFSPIPYRRSSRSRSGMTALPLLTPGSVLRVTVRGKLDRSPE
ncbi:hypothetical protein Micbo1qcDRAFT_4725 [Microdochium bolleyi]|uniref:C2H2-type domain-containing protein n=1 Tax=Microdochium bolleyi TaxID=196109 RepID=A0A136JIM1_9PEZI|nr:hypothetical protein Micbo1qcDRAFT_4725 [Microdochium bolleyi]